jgi:outer membrane protein TolC
MLEALVNEALATNPEIKASEARWQMFAAKVRQAGSLEDPMLMLRIQSALIKDPLAFDQEPMTAKVIGISQKVPFYGKRSLMREGAELEAESNRWALEERKVELRQMVKETWYQLYFIDRSLEVVNKNIGLLDDLTRFSETMYGVGQGLQQDVLKAQIDRSRMEDMRIVLQQKRRTLAATLNTLAYRPAENEIPLIPAIELTPFAMTATDLEALAEVNRPSLKALKAKIEKARVNQRLSEKEFYPDFTFSLEYMQRDPAMESPGDDMYSFGVSFNLPLQRERRHAMVAESASEQLMATADLNMQHNQIRFSIADSLARLESSSKLAMLYREGILPQAGNALEAAMAAYRVGKADFMNVLDSQMRQFNYEREYYDAVADHEMQLAQLERVVGTALPFVVK